MGIIPSYWSKTERRLYGAVAGLVVVAGDFAVGTTHWLDQATARQCANADWPVKADDIHRDWCVSNGYDIPPRGSY